MWRPALQRFSPTFRACNLASIARASSTQTIQGLDRPLRVAIIGQEQFGAAVYKRLKRDGHEIVGVFTPPDKGNKKDPLAIAAATDNANLVRPKRWQRKGVVDDAVIAEYEACKPDLNVMAYVSQLIPMQVINHPKFQTIQYHPSLLPKRRGRSAINHSIVNGDGLVGFSIFWPDEGLDTGPVLLQRARVLHPQDNVMTAYNDFLYPEGVESMSTAVQLVAAGLAPKLPQLEADMTYDAPWEKEVAAIDLSWPAQRVHNWIRGSDPLPGAYVFMNGEKTALFGSTLLTNDEAEELLARSPPLGVVALRSAVIGEEGPTASGPDVEAVVTGEGLMLTGADGARLLVDAVKTSSGRTVKASALLDDGTSSIDLSCLAPEQQAVADAVAAVWAGVLGVEPQELDADASFFESGGGSMEAVQLVGNLTEELGLTLPGDAAYLHPSLAEMTAYVLAVQSGGGAAQGPQGAPEEAVEYLEVAVGGKTGNVQLRAPVRHLIGGNWVAGGGGTVPSTNPATEQVICQLANGTPADVDAAVAAARAALDGPGKWRSMDARERGALLARVADRMEAHRGELALLESIDSGIPLTLADKTHIGMSISVFRYFSGWADKIQGKTIPIPHPGPNSRHLTFTKHEPVGVVGAIIPWNFPSMMLSWKLAPALAAGNTVVLKPAEHTCLTALRILEIMTEECGLPAGVVNVVMGPGRTVGQRLAEHPDVDKVAFTGSTATGIAIQNAAAPKIKRVSLELGGKSALVVFADCDLQAAAKAALSAAFFNMGQNCCAGSRVFVEESVRAEFTELVMAAAQRITVGDPLDRRTEQGPQNHEAHFNKIMDYIQQGEAAGARLLFGGRRRGDTGYFIGPTIFDGVTDDMTISREEIFGPVMCIHSFKNGDVKGVIARANDTAYGLAGGVFSSDFGKAMAVVDGVKAGTMWINTYNVTDAAAPFGGFKESGNGRDLSEYALHEYTEVKAVTVKYDTHS